MQIISQVFLELETIKNWLHQLLPKRKGVEAQPSSDSTQLKYTDVWRREKTLTLGKTEGRRKTGRQRMRLLGAITDSMDVNLSKLWEIFGMLQSKGLQRIGHNLGTEQQQWRGEGAGSESEQCSYFRPLETKRGVRRSWGFLPHTLTLLFSAYVVKSQW